MKESEIIEQMQKQQKDMMKLVVQMSQKNIDPQINSQKPTPNIQNPSNNQFYISLSISIITMLISFIVGYIITDLKEDIKEMKISNKSVIKRVYNIEKDIYKIKGDLK